VTWSLVGLWNIEGSVEREVARRRCLVPAVWSAAASQRTVSDVSMCGGKERRAVWQVQRPLKLAQQVTLPGTSLVDGTE
jgi:hypothetical protein